MPRPSDPRWGGWYYSLSVPPACSGGGHRSSCRPKYLRGFTPRAPKPERHSLSDMTGAKVVAALNEEAAAAVKLISEAFQKVVDEKKPKQLRIGIVSESLVEVWGMGTKGMLAKISVAKARSLKDGKALKSKPSCCGDLCCFLCGCSKQMAVKGAVLVKVDGINDAHSLVVCGFPTGDADLETAQQILTSCGYTKGDAAVWAKTSDGGGAPAGAEMER